MKTIGYGWVKTGMTLKAAMKKYGVTAEGLKKKPDEALKDFQKQVDRKILRRSARPKLVRVVLEEIDY